MGAGRENTRVIGRARGGGVVRLSVYSQNGTLSSRALSSVTSVFVCFFKRKKKKRGKKKEKQSVRQALTQSAIK